MAPVLPLVDLKTIYGDTLTFDRSKISMLRLNAVPPPIRGEPEVPLPDLATEVFGISSGAIFTADKAPDILSRFDVSDKFITLTYTTGYLVWIRASAVSSIFPRDQIQDPRVKCNVLVSGKQEPVIEDYAAVRQRVDEIRKNDGGT